MAAPCVCKYFHLSENITSFRSVKRADMKQRISKVMNRCYATRSREINISQVVTGSSSYEEVQLFRKNQAKHSVLVQYTQPATIALEMIKKYGRINSAHCFSREMGDVKHYALVEYRHLDNVKNIVSSARQFPNLLRIPAETRLLFCRYPSERRSKNTSPRDNIDNVITQSYGSCDLSNDDLLNCSSLEDQISLLYEKQTLSELDIRLRYFLCSEIEAVVHKIYPEAVTRLFGSSVNGFGRYNCDLDVVLDLCNPLLSTNADESLMHRQGGMYFMTKMRNDNERHFAQNTLDLIAGLIANIIPQMVNVRRILRARIPIVKFQHVASGIDCDICIDNGPALVMSELLYFMSTWENINNHINHRVPALIFAVRHWSRSSEITRSNPGHWLSNFMLTLLTIHFLQMRPKQILPSLKSIKDSPVGSKAISPDISIPVDPKKLTFARNNSEKLGELLLEFFEYYASFDFSKAGISIIEGMPVSKPETDPAPMYIENPVERELNVAKNVQEVYVSEFQSRCRVARDSLAQSLSPQRSRQQHWGLLTILSTSEPGIGTEMNNGDSRTLTAANTVVQTDGNSSSLKQMTGLNIVELYNNDDVDTEVATTSVVDRTSLKHKR